MAHLFQIHEADLCALESTLPKLADTLGMALNRPEVQVMVEQVKDILSSVRWNYGPPQSIEVMRPRDEE